MKISYNITKIKTRGLFSLLLFAFALLANLDSNAQYCAPYGPQYGFCCGPSNFMGIQGFTMGTINTSDGPPTVVYTNYSASQSTNANIGQTMNFTMTTNGAYNQYIKIWVDWNNNGSFDNILGSELMYNIELSTLSTVTGSFVVPCTTGGPKRMRVASDYYGVSPTYGGFPPMDPCGAIYYGNMHDYTINVATPIPVKAQFTTSDTVFVNSSFKAINAAANQSSWLFQWDFNNDGSVEYYTPNATHTFTTTGTKQIKLKASSCTDKDSMIRTVVVANPTQAPVADFLASKFTALPYETISLQDMSTNGATKWKWEITPASPFTTFTPNDSSQNPTVTFGDAGVYTVCLTASNSAGTSVKNCKTAYITVKAINYMCIFPNVTQGAEGELYDAGGPSGNYSPNSNCDFLIAPCASSVTMKFTQFLLGSTAASLKIYDGKNANAPLIGVYTNASPLPGGTAGVKANSGSMYLVWTSGPSTSVAAGFAATWTSVVNTNVVVAPDFILPDTAYELTDVSFINTSTGSSLNYDWDFDGDGNSDAATEHGIFNFPVPQRYYPTLTISDACGNLLTKLDSIDIIVPSQAPVVNFKADLTVVTTNDTVKFTDMSSFGPFSWNYIFNPATATIVGGTAKNPWVRFNSLGTYNVTLDASNNIGTGTLTKTAYIKVVSICQGGTTGLVPDLGINRVTIGNIDNVSPSGSAGFTSYFNSIAPFNMDAGGTYSISVSRNSTLNKMNRKVWIDYNIDGDFTDAGELVGSEPAALTANWKLTFTVPVSAAKGATRLRIGTAFGDSTNEACGPNFYGEIEEYRVVINFDITPPLITLLGNNPVSVEIGHAYVDAGATAFDAVDGDVSDSIVVTNPVNILSAGTYTVRYNVMDSLRNKAIEVTRTVIVTADKTSPELTLSIPLIVTIPVYTSFVEPGYAATDNISGNVTGSVIIDRSALDTAHVGSYLITYTATDAAGNTDVKTRRVNVVDLAAPVLTMNGADPMEIEVFTVFTDPGVTVSDNYDQVITYSAISTVNPNALGSYVVTYTSQDASGNISSIQRTVNVVDKTIPVIRVFGKDTITLEVNSVFNIPYIVATDNYDMNPVVTAITGYNVHLLGEYNIKYIATDASGNQSLPDSVLLRIVDTQSPVITLNGSYLVTVKRWSSYSDPGAIAQDNYQTTGLTIVTGGTYVNTLNPGIFYITYDVTDQSGNKAAQVIRAINVVEGTTGISDVSNNIETKMYPNPASENVTVELVNSSFSKGRIDIVNMLGKTVRSITPDDMSSEQIIGVSDLAAGIYFLHVENKGNISVQRLMISR